MIVELVTFKSPEGWDRGQVLEDAKGVVPKWVANPDLIRKHFLLGIGEDEGTGAGLYLWPSIEAAKRVRDDAWRESVRKRTGGYPTIRYFDLLMLIDKENGSSITEYDAEGRPAAFEPA